MIRTKIVATMGPACANDRMLLQLFEAGADVCRLNFSHGTLDQHLHMLGQIRQAAARFEHPVAVLGDLCGPKIRLGQVADDENAAGMSIKVGDNLVIQRQSLVGHNGRVSTTYPQLIDEVEVGDRVLIEDGLLRFICTDKKTDEIHCSCTAGGILQSSKGINLPETAVGLPSITARDWECVDWAIENDLDYLALSFVRRADELLLLREHLRDQAGDIHLIAKIEKAEALEQIDSILEASDGLMIARGDLGVEMDMAEVPIIQKDLINRCQIAGKPVIVATQMLQSMIEQSSPTRAEVSDVANAIYDGADAVMLSGETSIGKFPAGSVHMMAHIADVTEDYLARNKNHKEPLLKLKSFHLSAAVAKGAWRIVQDMDVRLVVIWSQSGETARIFSKNRFAIPIIALSNNPKALRRMALHYGVLPQEMPPPRDMSALVDKIDRLVQQRKFAAAGDQIIIVAGSSLGMPGTMNGLVIHTLGKHWTMTPQPRNFSSKEIKMEEP